MIRQGTCQDCGASASKKNTKRCRECYLLSRKRWACGATGDTHDIYTCKDCQNIYARNYVARHRDSVLEYRLGWRKDNPEKEAQYARAHHLKKKGWSVEELEAARVSQDGRCYICGEEKPLEADHCHRTGRRRHLLCGGCNKVLGFARERPEVLRAAAEYLEESVIDAVRLGEFQEV